MTRVNYYGASVEQKNNNLFILPLFSHLRKKINNIVLVHIAPFKCTLQQESAKFLVILSGVVFFRCSLYIFSLKFNHHRIDLNGWRNLKITLYLWYVYIIIALGKIRPRKVHKNYFIAVVNKIQPFLHFSQLYEAEFTWLPIDKNIYIFAYFLIDVLWIYY